MDPPPPLQPRSSANPTVHEIQTLRQRLLEMENRMNRANSDATSLPGTQAAPMTLLHQAVAAAPPTPTPVPVPSPDSHMPSITLQSYVTPPSPPGLPPPPLPIGPPPPLPPGLPTTQISQAYTSVLTRNQGHPGQPTAQGLPYANTAIASGFQPFAGAAALVPPQSTHLANQARRASASTIPSRSNASGAQRRGRGPAQRSPSLPISTTRGGPPSVLHTLIEGAPEPTARITVKVYPPKDTDEWPLEFILHDFLKPHFNTVLNKENLLFNYEMPLAAPMTYLLERVAQQMRESSFRFVQQEQEEDPTAHNRIDGITEDPPLQILEAVNRARIRPSTRAPHLRPSSFDSRRSLRELMSMTMTLVVPKCIERGRLLINLYVVHFGLENNWNGVMHKCLSAHLYSIFPDDATVDREACIRYESYTCLCEDQLQALPEVANAETAIVTIPATADAEEGEIDELLTPPTAPPAAQDQAQVIPPVIWEAPWVPEPMATTYNIRSFREQIFARIYPIYEDAPALTIRGSNMAEIVDSLMEEISDAVGMKDCSRLLSPNRTFELVVDGRLISYGNGVEREALLNAYTRYTGEQRSAWLVQQADDMHTLLTQIPGHSLPYVNQTRIRRTEMFGVLCALMMICGLTPEPLDPCIFQFIIHNQNLESLTEGFVGEWHPELRQLLKRWKEVGIDGNISFMESYLQSYQSIPCAAVRERDWPLHEALAGQILYSVIFGRETTNHPEWQAFIRGFRLPCPNGFDFTKAIKAIEGGSESYLNFIWASRQCGIKVLESVLTVTNAPREMTTALSRVARPNGPPGHGDFSVLLHKYLSGVGIPYEPGFVQVENAFDTIIDVSKIFSPEFRSRMFVYATTGAPYIGTQEQEIEVKFVDDDSQHYMPGCSLERRDRMIAEGKICFRTCLRLAIIPCSFILKLAERDYDSVTEGPTSFSVAFDHWMLMECLFAIGGHSIL